MRQESLVASLGGNAMLDALSTALFTMTLRLASESADTPVGLLSMAGHPRLAPALTAIFNDPARAWTLPELGCGAFSMNFVQSVARRLDQMLGS